MTSKSRALNAEEEQFLSHMLIRATSPGVGQPYISLALFKLKPYSAPGLKTMGVDKHWRLYIDFEYMMEKGVEYGAGILAHEPWHLLRDHNRRFNAYVGDERKARLWNIVGDLELNDDIKKLVPADSIFPATADFVRYPEFQTAEEYWEILQNDKENQEKYDPQPAPCSCKQPSKKGKDDGGKKDGGEQPGGKGDEKQDGGDGDEEGDGSGSGDEDSDEEGDGSGSGSGDSDSDEEGDGSGDGGTDPSDCPVHGDHGQAGNGPACGSGSGGSEFTGYELPYDESDSVDEEEEASIKRQVAEAAREHELSKPGTVPGFVSDWAKEVLSHKPIDWRKALAADVKRAVNWKKGNKDYVRKIPRRRQPIEGVLLPGMRSPKPTILVGIDTSGSNMHKVPVVLEELAKITKQVGVRGNELRAFAVDVDVDAVKPVNDPFTVLDGSRMYGGTDMRPAYRFAATIKPRSDIFILCTDGEVGGKQGWDTEPPKGSGNIKFITVLIVDKGSSWADSIVEDAQATVGKWSSIIVVDVAEED